jgi:hypothetical protein
VELVEQTQLFGWVVDLVEIAQPDSDEIGLKQLGVDHVPGRVVGTPVGAGGVVRAHEEDGADRWRPRRR